MDISIQHAGKKYGKHWIFKSIDLQIPHGEKIAILGANGSGKSTLLKCIAHHTALSAGEITWKNNQDMIQENAIYKHYSLISPSLELIEELTLIDFLKLHFSFKKITDNISIEEVIQIVQLDKARQKPIKYFSSGMKQRVKLLIAFFTQNPVLLLDEPTSNLDIAGIEIYQNLIKNYTYGKTIIVASNVLTEYEFCHKNIQL